MHRSLAAVSVLLCIAISLCYGMQRVSAATATTARDTIESHTIVELGMARNAQGNGQTSRRSSSNIIQKGKGSKRFARSLSELLESRVFLSAGDGLRGIYFNSINHTGTWITRVDPTVNFDWRNGSPDSSLKNNNFSIRWRGQIEPRFTEIHTFHTRSDDGARLYIDGKLIVDDWTEHSASKEATGTIALTAGRKHDIVMEYFDTGGQASARLSWSSDSQVKEIVPQSQLYSSPAFPAPMNVTASALSTSSIQLKWSESAHMESGFKIERSTAGGAFVQIATTQPNTTTFTDSNLSEGTSYTYRLRAFGIAADGAYSSTAAVTTLQTIPAPPSSLAADVDGINVALTWVDNSATESGFLIQRSASAGDEIFEDFATVAANVTSFVTREHNEGSDYAYRVRAFNSGGESDYTSAARVTTGSQSPYASVPAAVPGTIEAENFDHGGDGVAYFDLTPGNTGNAGRASNVDLRTAEDENGGETVAWTQAGEWLEYTVDVAGSGEYVLETRVASAGAGGTFRILADGNDLTGAVAIPDTGGWQNWQTLSQPVTLTAGRQVLRLAFESNGASGYVGNLNWLRFAQNIPHVTGLVLVNADTSEDLFALTDGAVIDFSKLSTRNLNVRADVDAHADSVLFDLNGDQRIENFAPFALAGDFYEAGYRHWTPDLGVNELYVTPYTRDYASGLEGPAVYVRFHVIDPVTRAAAPSALAATALGSSRIELTWADNSDSEAGFKIQLSTDGSTWSDIGAVADNLTSHTATALNPATSYQFRVAAFNEAGDSDHSNVAVATTAALATPVIDEKFASHSANLLNVDGVWATAGGHYRLTHADTRATPHLNNRAVHKTALGGDFVASVDASVPALNATGTWNDVALIFGYQDADNYYFFSSNQSNDHLTHGIFRVLDGVSTELADASGGLIKPGATYALRVERVGDRVHAHRNDALVASATDSTFMTGRIGVGAKSNLATFSNLLAYGAEAPVLPPPLVVPAAPTMLLATASGTSSIDLVWQDNSSEEQGFKIEQSGDGVSGWTQVATADINEKIYKITGLNPASTYHFRVFAFNTAGNSAYSNVASATTAPVVSNALFSEDFGAAGASNFTIIDGTWVADGSFQIHQFSTSATSHLNNRAIHNTAVAGDFTATIDASVSPGAWNDFALIFGYQDENNYYFFSSNQTNDGGTSGIFRVAAGETSELADVAAPIVGGVTYPIRVERVGDRIDAYRGGVLIASAVDSTFMAGHIGVGAKGNAASFDNLVVTGIAAPPTTSVPNAPSSLEAYVVSSSRIDLTWSDNAADERGFKIERSSDGGNSWTQIGTVGANDKSYSVTGLAAETTYDFRVRAYNAAGDSVFAAPVAATTKAATQPQQPSTRPGPDNTGPSNPSILKASGSIVVTKDGTVLENLFVTGKITIQANNVTIRNVKINAKGQAYGIKTFSNFKNVLVEDGEIYGANGALVTGDGMTIRRLNLHHSGGDAVNPYGNFVMEYCWVHHLGMNEGSHADGVQMGGGKDFIFRYNFFDMPKGPGGNSLVEGGQTFRSNAAFFFSSASGNPTNVTIENNWINGGNYTMYVWGSGHQITNNRFGRNYKYGVITSNSYGYTASGNVWDDTGAALKL